MSGRPSVGARGLTKFMNIALWPGLAFGGFVVLSGGWPRTATPTRFWNKGRRIDVSTLVAILLTSDGEPNAYGSNRRRLLN